MLKIAETLRKDKDLMSMVTNFKNSSPSEEMQRRSAGILFTMNDLQKKGWNLKLQFIIKNLNLK